MRSITPAESVHAKDGSALASPDVRFFSLSDPEQMLAVGAFQRLDDRHAEIKSMHTVEAARGRGVGAFMLTHILNEARAEGFSRVSLETGATEHFAPARRLYARHGFESCGPFGTYLEDPHSAFMTRTLT